MRLVIKIGSAVLSNKDGGLNKEAVLRLARQVAVVHRDGHDVILVTSGAIAAGIGRLGLKEKPSELKAKQAAAAVGQLALLEAYEEAFNKEKIIPAQILLTREDISNGARYINLRNTFLHLLSLRCIPIVNENDSVSTEEIQFGDNDNLSALVAVKISADKLILLSDVPGYFAVDGEGNLTNKIIFEVSGITKEMEDKASKSAGSKVSTGGIFTKLAAAKLATNSGIETWIASGADAQVLSKIMLNQTGAGTRFLAQQKVAK